MLVKMRRRACPGSGRRCSAGLTPTSSCWPGAVQPGLATACPAAGHAVRERCCKGPASGRIRDRAASIPVHSTVPARSCPRCRSPRSRVHEYWDDPRLALGCDCVAGVVNQIEPSWVEVLIEVPDAHVDAEGRLLTLEVDRKLSICTVDELIAGMCFTSINPRIDQPRLNLKSTGPRPQSASREMSMSPARQCSSHVDPR